MIGAKHQAPPTSNGAKRGRCDLRWLSVVRRGAAGLSEILFFFRLFGCCSVGCACPKECRAGYAQSSATLKRLLVECRSCMIREVSRPNARYLPQSRRLATPAHFLCLNPEPPRAPVSEHASNLRVDDVAPGEFPILVENDRLEDFRLRRQRCF